MSAVEQRIVLVDSDKKRALPQKEKQVVEAAARARLQRSLYPELRHVSCEFHEGLLTLRGRVPSYYLKQVAQTAVYRIEGVGELNNRLQVAPLSYPT